VGFGGPNPWAEFAGRAKTELLDSVDLAVVGIAGQMIYLEGKRKPARTEISALGKTLLDKAHSIDPQNPHWSVPFEDMSWTERDLWAGGAPPPMTVPAAAVRVAPEAQSGRLLSHGDVRCVATACPTGGTFRLEAVIGKDGSVKELHANAGNASTIQMAMEAARYWSYDPVLVEGRPVEVATEIDVAMTRVKMFTPPTVVVPSANPPIANPPISGGPLPTGVFRVGGGVSQPAITHKVDPIYSEEARKAKYSGSVRLSFVVDIDGKAKNIQVTRGVGLGLDGKAIDAVRQWTFLPGMKDGKPVPVYAEVEVNFRLLVEPPAPAKPPQ
jgi:TonB family protein